MLSRYIFGAIGALLLTGTALAQGPVILMGIDAEDGGPGGHGPITAYTSVINSGIVTNVSNGGSGLLVVGGNKNPTDNVTRFWDAIGANTGLSITYVNSPADISAQSFAGFGIIGIASSFSDTPSGGLTAAEGAAINARSADIGAHVNGGGGLIGFSQGGIAEPYGYLGALGSVSVSTGLGYSSVTPTADGIAIGITDTNLDVCCWHDEYATFPAFLKVLAVNDSTGRAAAIGGFDVIIVDGIVLTPVFTQVQVNANHTLTASVADSLGTPLPAVDVTFDIISGPNMGLGGMGVTDAAGEATFSYSSASLGLDVVEACFTDSAGALICSNTAEVEWINSNCILIDFETEDDFLTPMVNGQAVDTANAMGELMTMSGTGGSGLGAAIFDSDPVGPNATSDDPDLLVGSGNLVIVQENPGQTVPGIYDEPDDDALGATVVFNFLQDTELCAIDLVDVDLDTFFNQSASLLLIDAAGMTRTYSVPAGWTEDRVVDGGGGSGTLDLRTMMPQMGFVSVATATEDSGFDPLAVRTLTVDFGSSGAMDNLSIQVAAPGPGGPGGPTAVGAMDEVVTTAPRPTAGG